MRLWKVDGCAQVANNIGLTLHRAYVDQDVVIAPKDSQ